MSDNAPLTEPVALPPGFVFRTDPFDHQLDEWNASKDSEYRAILWEQGTGKTKLTIDTASCPPGS